LTALVAARPDATLAELREALRTSAGVATIWRDRQPMHDARQYVFLDECGVTTDLIRRYGRSPRGTRLRDHAPFGHWKPAR
jgi:hypothetical protein